ncbi:winged helix DNA-binding protein [Leptolyngbya sp. 15MV]|nr:winged helix DNA-binding protein [Leptolyngbya sp. 15MV]
MALSDFAYQAVGDVPSALSVSILADRSLVRADWHEDAAMAGLRVDHVGPLSSVDDDPARALGDVVLVDCPDTGGAALAALARIDVRAARAGARLVVATSCPALDAVFGCLELSRPEILLDPARGERVVALARVMAGRPNGRLRDLSEDDRLALLRLTEQVGELAERLERMGQSGLAADGSAFRFASPVDGFRGADGEGGARRAPLRRAKPPLPDPRLVRRVIQARQLRARWFDPALFADPAWDILLDLTAARAEHTRVSVTSLCIASGVPPTTALRWIGQMIEAGLLERVRDDSDRRRAFIALSDKAAEAMARYFAELARDAARLT